jgi:hypothetical protein
VRHLGGKAHRQLIDITCRCAALIGEKTTNVAAQARVTAVTRWVVDPLSVVNPELDRSLGAYPVGTDPTLEASVWCVKAIRDPLVAHEAAVVAKALDPETKANLFALILAEYPTPPERET